jgi:hypothetical protein
MPGKVARRPDEALGLAARRQTKQKLNDISLSEMEKTLLFPQVVVGFVAATRTLCI